MSSTGKEIGRFFKHSSIYAIGNVLNRIGAFLLLPVYTNYLTVEQYGVLELFYATTAVFSGLLSVGIAHATLRFYFNYEDQSERNAVVSTNYIMSLSITVIGAIVIGYWNKEIVHLILGNGGNHNEALLIVLATLVLELSSQVSLAYIRAIEKSVLFIVLVLVKLGIQITVNSYLVIVEKLGVEGVLLGNLSAVAIGWIILSIFTVRKCGLRFEKSKSIPVLRYSFPFLLSTMTAIVSVNSDKFILGRLISLEEVGIYGLAMKFALLLDQLIGEPFNRAYGAFRFSIMDRKDSSEIQSNIVTYLMIGGAWASLGIVLFTPDVLRIMSDQKFWGAANLLPLLVLANYLKLLYYPFQTGILVEKKTRYIFYTGLLAACVSLVANFVLIFVIGVIGACISQVIIALTLVTTTNTISQRYHPVRYEYRKLVGLIFLLSTAYLASQFVSDISLWTGLLEKSLIMIVFSMIVFYSGILSTKERMNIVNWIRNWFRKRHKLA